MWLPTKQGCLAYITPSYRPSSRTRFEGLETDINIITRWLVRTGVKMDNIMWNIMTSGVKTIGVQMHGASDVTPGQLTLSGHVVCIHICEICICVVKLMFLCARLWLLSCYVRQ
jgi:hypothetical protein